MMSKKTLEDLPLKRKCVLMRVDYNVPLNPDGSISDDTRIRATLPSIEYILNHNASLILMSHLGRPKGIDPKYTLLPCAHRLAELLQRPVQFASDCIGPDAKAKASALKPGEILLLENLRFYPGEEEPEKDPAFASALAKFGDVYVNDAFGTAHRAHTSTALLAKFFPQRAATGFLMQKEIEALTPLAQQPERPFYAIIGGAKVSTKIGLIQSLLKSVDGLFLGGGMIFTFLKAQGFEIGDSLFESEQLQTAKDILKKGSEKIHFPSDIVIADAFSNDAHRRSIKLGDPIPPGWQGLDIGPKTIQEWSIPLSKAATVFWNGPVGVFEMPHFANGTLGIAKILAHSKAKAIVGGGDSISAIEKSGLANLFFHLSTGGGAAIEYLEFGHLPGIDALSEK
jgi:phosphoglycerate kinase